MARTRGPRSLRRGIFLRRRMINSAARGNVALTRPKFSSEPDMRVAMAAFLATSAAITAWWWCLGRPVPLPPSPLATGEKLACISYAPFRGSQSPLDPSLRVDARQIEDDLTRVATLTKCVDTYSTSNGLDQVPEIAARHGLT